MAEIYTNPGGSSPAAQATARLREALSQLTGMSSMDLANQAYSAQLNQPAIEAQAQQDLTQQSGIPQLQSGQQDLGKIFELYLADNGLSQKYMNKNDTNPYTSPILNANTGNGQIGGEATSAPNPYLNATPDQIIASTQPSEGSFATPSQNTRAMMAVPSSAVNLLDMLQTAITGQEGLVKSKMGDVSRNYQAKMGVLQSLVDAATKKEGAGRQTAFNDNGDLVDMQTGEIIQSYGGGTNAFGQKMGDEARGFIDSIKPNISWATVGPAGKTMGAIPGTPAYDFTQQVEGLKGNLRVTTLSELKAMGGTMGQLSNEEGRALESAIGKLDTGQSPDAFRKQLEKIENYLIKAYTPAGGGKQSSSANTITQDDGTVWKKNTNGSYTRIK